MPGLGAGIRSGAPPSFLLPKGGILAGFGVSRERFQSQGIHLFWSHAAKPIGNPGVGHGHIHCVADGVVKPAGLCGELLPVVADQPFPPLVRAGTVRRHVSLIPQTLVSGGRVSGHTGHAQISAVFAQALVDIRNAGGQYLIHFFRRNAETQIFKLVNGQLLLNVENGHGIVKIKHRVWPDGRIILRGKLAETRHHVVKSFADQRVPTLSRKHGYPFGRGRGGERGRRDGQNQGRREADENTQIFHSCSSC